MLPQFRLLLAAVGRQRQQRVAHCGRWVQTQARRAVPALHAGHAQARPKARVEVERPQQLPLVAWGVRRRGCADGPAAGRALWLGDARASIALTVRRVTALTEYWQRWQRQQRRHCG